MVRTLASAGTRFTREQLLGSGSQGDVYRAHDRHLEIDVAIKCIGELSPAAVSELKTEFRTASALSHPNLVPLHELFVEGGTAYFSMDLVDGVDLLSAVGPPGNLDPDLLVRLAIQLCQGLSALHEVGLVHRDIKPQNILVRPDGRLVLLDFGFTRDERAVPCTPQPSEGLVGTFAYMAPEQFAGAAVGAAADAYAVGALLHEALTGSTPDPWFGARNAAATTASLPERTPEPLRSLVESLLSPDPDRRPSMVQACAILEGTKTPEKPLLEQPFVGRTEERRALLAAIHSAVGGSVVEVLGASGVGKTELVRRVLTDLGSDDSIVLRSRCRSSESVPFQALDAVIDDLGLELVRRNALGTDDQLRRNAVVASILFSSLRRLPDLEEWTPIGDPIERRREAVSGLRRLFASVANERRVVVWIDDAQWADSDSIALITDLVRSSDAPPIHWVLTTRTLTRGTSELGESLVALRQGRPALEYRTITLDPLTAEDSAHLVRSLAGHRVLTSEAMLEIVRAGAGYPFVIAGLATLETAVTGTPISDAYSFILTRSTADLKEDERRILELVALSRQPTDLELLLEAAGIGSAGVLSIRKLESRRLVRTAPWKEGTLVDSYHDQVPETLLARLADDPRREGHRRLARAHEKRSSDAAVLCHHFHGAGEMRQASSYAEQAGRQADAALAFARAAELFRSARIWDPDAEPERSSSLLEMEGSALANAGSLAAAGDRYLIAAGHRDGIAALELRRRAVESLLAGGRVDQALSELRSLLAALGLGLPRGEYSALLRAVGALARYLANYRSAARRLASPENTPRSSRLQEPGTAPIELLRIDTCYSAGRRLADIDPSRGTYLLAASLSRSARSGDPARIARSLCTAGGALGAVGGAVINRLGERLMASAERVSLRLGDEELAGMVDVAYGEIHMLAGRWREALTRSRAGVEKLQEKPGYVFECNVGRGVVLRALEELGEIREEYAEGRAFLESATAHHNSYAEIRAAQHLTVACLALGRSDEARSYLRMGFDRWMDGAFQMQHLYAARNEALCDLYDGDPEHGSMVLDTVEEKFRRSVLRQVPLIRIDMHWLRGQLALMVPSPANLSLAKRAIRDLEAEARPDARLRSLLLKAGFQAAQGRVTEQEILAEAEGLAADQGAQLLEEVIRHVISEAGGNHDHGSDGLAELRTRGVGDPEKYASMLCRYRPR